MWGCPANGGRRSSPTPAGEPLISDDSDGETVVHRGRPVAVRNTTTSHGQRAVGAPLLRAAGRPPDNTTTGPDNGNQTNSGGNGNSGGNETTGNSSGTEPVVRVMVEAPSEAAAQAAGERVVAAVVGALGAG